MFSSQKRRSASFLGRREFNGSGSAVTGKKIKRANSPAADGTRRPFIEDDLRDLSPTFLFGGDTGRLHRCTADASRMKPEMRSFQCRGPREGEIVGLDLDDKFLRG